MDQCKSSVDDSIGCMGTAERNIDIQHISGADIYSISEDGQTVSRVGARGGLVKAWSCHVVRNIFLEFADIKKDPALPMSKMDTIDTGADASKAIVGFMDSMNEDPVFCISLALDGDGTNTGRIKGVKGRVNFTLSSSLSAFLCDNYCLHRFLIIRHMLESIQMDITNYIILVKGLNQQQLINELMHIVLR